MKRIVIALVNYSNSSLQHSIIEVSNETSQNDIVVNFLKENGFKIESFEDVENITDVCFDISVIEIP